MKYLSAFLLFLSGLATAQFKEDFSESLSSPHVWDGSSSSFKINSDLQLQSNGLAASEKIFLQTYSNALTKASWNFWLKMNFESSTTNYTKVFLAASSDDLLDPELEAYYLKIGGLSGSKDGIDLYYQKGSSQTLVAKGIEGHASGKAVTLRIQVLHGDSGKWNVYSDTTGGENFKAESSGVHAAAFSVASFGFLCVHSSTRRTSFYFDDLFIDGGVVDAQAPSLLSQRYVDKAWFLTFDEVLNPLSVPVLTRTDGSVFPVQLTWINKTTFSIRDTLSLLEPGTGIHLKLNGIKDHAGNTATVAVFLVKPKPIEKGEVVINEVLFNPFPYGADFVELYNRSSWYVELEGMQLQNQDQEVFRMPSFIASPGAYVVLTKDSMAIREFYPKAARSVFVTSDLPAFPDKEGSVRWLDSLGVAMDRLNYTQAMHNPLLENDEGVSLEKVDAAVSSDWPANWQSASNASGGATPGYVNSQANSGSSQEGFMRIEPHSISPGTDGYRNYATIRYHLPKPGGSLRLDVFSLQGHWICSLQPSGPADVHGICTWNGTDSNLQPVRTGLYLIVAEFFHPDGDRIKIKDTISVLLR